MLQSESDHLLDIFDELLHLDICVKQFEKVTNVPLWLQIRDQTKGITFTRHLGFSVHL